MGYYPLTFSRDKLKTARENELNLVLEDSPETAMVFNKNRIPVIYFLDKIAPYGRDVKGERIISVTNWRDAYDSIKDIDNVLREREKSRRWLKGETF